MSYAFNHFDELIAPIEPEPQEEALQTMGSAEFVVTLTVGGKTKPITMRITFTNHGDLTEAEWCKDQWMDGAFIWDLLNEDQRFVIEQQLLQQGYPNARLT